MTVMLFMNDGVGFDDGTDDLCSGDGIDCVDE